MPPILDEIAEAIGVKSRIPWWRSRWIWSLRFGNSLRAVRA